MDANINLENFPRIKEILFHRAIYSIDATKEQSTRVETMKLTSLGREEISSARTYLSQHILNVANRSCVGARTVNSCPILR